MNLKEKVDGILESITNNVEWLAYYPKSKRGTLEYAYRKGLISDAQIDFSLTKGIVKRGLFFYQQVLNGQWPDHVTHPEYLAYVISTGLLTPREVSRISFDHGEDAQEFCRVYGVPNLIGRLWKELMNPSPLPNFSNEPGGFCDTCPSCCGH